MKYSLKKTSGVYVLKSAPHRDLLLGLRFGLGLVLVLICSKTTVNGLSNIVSIDYKNDVATK